MRWFLLLSLSLLAGCPKKKLDDALAARDAAAEQVELMERRMTSLSRDHVRLQEQLAAAEERAEEAGKLAQEMKDRNEALRTALGEAQAAMEAISSRSAADRKAKDALEARLRDVAAELEFTERSAGEAQARLEEMAAEAERLRAEKDRLAAKTAEYDALVSSLEDEIEAGTVKVTELSGKLTVNLSNAILFDSGRYQVRAEGREALSKVAGVLAGVEGRDVMVEGHTDDVPVGRGASYADNWALSSLRASAVVALLVDAGVAPDRVAAVGYADQRPVAPNDSADNRAANRRTEIVLVPRLESREVDPGVVEEEEGSDQE